MTAPEPNLLCPRCGYDLRALREGRCPECGFGYDHAALRDISRERVARRDSMARWILVRAAVALVCFALAAVAAMDSPSLGWSFFWKWVISILLFAFTIRYQDWTPVYPHHFGSAPSLHGPHVLLSVLFACVVVAVPIVGVILGSIVLVHAWWVMLSVRPEGEVSVQPLEVARSGRWLRPLSWATLGIASLWALLLWGGWYAR